MDVDKNISGLIVGLSVGALPSVLPFGPDRIRNRSRNRKAGDKEKVKCRRTFGSELYLYSIRTGVKWSSGTRPRRTFKRQSLHCDDLCFGGVQHEERNFGNSILLRQHLRMG